ncbi:MAG: hypothetical protein ACK5AZ_18935 [Bryobacteraceae bacterium]
MTFAIQLPCIEFEAEAHVYGEDRPAPLELAALKFIYARNFAGEKPVLNDLVDFLSVGKWIAYQILIGFWTRGWVLIYPESGGVTLSPAIQQRLSENRLEGMQPSLQPARLRFIYDLVAGQVAPHPGQKVLRQERRSDDFTYPKRRPETQGQPGKMGWERFDMPLDGYVSVSNSELQAALVRHSYYREHLRGRGIDQLELKILSPSRGLTPSLVRYYSVDFDVYKTGSGELRLEVNDDRPIQRMLGKKLEAAILTALPDGPRLEASLKNEASSRDVVASPVRRPLPAFVDFLARLGDPRDATAGLHRRTLRELGEAWTAARIHLLDIVARRVDLAASTALLSTAEVHDFLRARLREPWRQVILSSPMASPAVLDHDPEGARTSFTELLAALGTSASKLFLVTTGDSHADARVQFAQLENSTTWTGVHSRSGPHIGASFATFDVETLLMSSEPILTETDQACLSLVFESRTKGVRGGPLLDLMDRLARDLALNEPGYPHLDRSKEAGRNVELPDDLSAILEAVDTLVAEQMPDSEEPGEGDDHDEGATFRGASAAVWLDELQRLSRDLENWVLQESEAAEVLVDSEIHDAALSLLERTPGEQPVVVGLSHASDLSRNLQMRDAIAQRASTCTGTLYLCLPGDPRLEAAVEELKAEFARNRKVVVLPGREGARWGFGFVLTPGASIVATRGVGQKIQNIGRARRGTEIGVLLSGRQLQKLALDIVGKTYSLREAADNLRLATDWRRSAQPGLLRLYSAWFSHDEPQADGNRGVTIVEPLLFEHPEMPWHPDDERLQAFPQECRHALLKSAARLAFRSARINGEVGVFDEALSQLALRHWNSGEILQAAILADWNGELPIGIPVLREMTVAVALGADYLGSPHDLLAERLDDAQRETFLALAALLLLDGRGRELGAFVGMLDDAHSAMRLRDEPLDNLVAALARRAAVLPETAFEPDSVRDMGDAPDLDGLWREAAAYVTQRRVSHTQATSVMELREILFKEAGSLLGDLSIFLADEAPNIAGDEQKIERLRKVLAKNAVDRSALRPKLAVDYFAMAHDQLKGRGYVNVLTSHQGKEVESVRRMLEFAAKIIDAAEYFSESSQLDRSILKFYRESAGVLGRDGRAAPNPILDKLSARLEAGHPLRRHAVPVHLLPTAAAALRPPDWTRLQSAYFEAELAPAPGKASPVAVMPLPDLLEHISALSPPDGVERASRRWKTSWHLLEVIGSMGVEVADEHELPSALRRFRRLLSARQAEIDRGLRTLRLKKASGDLVSADFERKRALLQQVLQRLRISMRGESQRVDEAAVDALDEAESLLAELHVHYGDAFDEARSQIENHATPIQMRHVRQLLEFDLLDAAWWLLKQGQDVSGAPSVPEADPQVTTLFQTCLQRSRFEVIPETALAENGVREDGIPLFSAFIRILHPLRRGLPSAGEVREAVFAFFGVEPGEDDSVEETAADWRLTSSNPTFLALAPYLVAKAANGCPAIEILLPKDRNSKGQVHQGVTTEGWRRVVFQRPAEALISPFGSGPEKTGQAAHGFSNLDEFLRAADLDARERTSVVSIPLMIDAFPASTIAPLPALTHRQLIGLMSRPPDQRRRACTRAAMGLASSMELADWWHQYGAFSDEFKQRTLAMMHARPYEELFAQSRDDQGLTDIISGTAEMLGIRIDSRVDASREEGESPAYLNWSDLRCIIYFSGGDLLNAHDLLFDGLTQDSRRRFIDLRAAIGANSNRRSINRFQCRLLPKSLAPSGDHHVSDFATLLEIIELASFEDDQPGFLRETFLANAEISLPRRDVKSLFDDMLNANLIAPITCEGAEDRFQVRKLPWFLSAPELA